MKLLIFMTVFLLAAPVTGFAVPANILGPWKSEGGDSRVELFKCADKICGKIVWLKNPEYIDAQDGPIGKTKVDWKNPNPSLRNRPIIGLQVMKGLTPKGSTLWGNGICYDPESGKSYKCKMKMTAPGRLELRGYIGISLIGRNFALIR